MFLIKFHVSVCEGSKGRDPLSETELVHDEDKLELSGTREKAPVKMSMRQNNEKTAKNNGSQ